MIRTFTLAIAALTALGAAQASAAPEQDRPVLKAEAIVTGDVVRIGDLVEHAGIVANVPIFRAPDLGSTGTVPADAVIEAVRAARAGRARHRRLQRSGGDAREPHDPGQGNRRLRRRRRCPGKFALGEAKDIGGQFRARTARNPGRAQCQGRAARRAHHLRRAQRPLRRHARNADRRHQSRPAAAFRPRHGDRRSRHHPAAGRARRESSRKPTC